MRWLEASPRRAAPKGHETFISRAASFSPRLLPRATPFRAHGAKCQELKEVGLAVSWGSLPVRIVRSGQGGTGRAARVLAGRDRAGRRCPGWPSQPVTFAMSGPEVET